MYFTFHIYGLIVGIAIVVAVSLIERQSKKLGYSESFFGKVIFSSLFFGIIGARVWHVATDFYLYKNNLQEVFYIWNGGLSIFGGVLGGVVGLYFVLKLGVSGAIAKKVSFLQFLDIAVFGLPFAQVIGRLGNFVNQELYGKPVGDFMQNSILSVFKVYISPENRLVEYENIEYYHPLFFYEMVLMLCFGLVIYYLNKKNRSKFLKLQLPKVGTGKLFLIYVLYYLVVRFLLDFVRLDKAVFGSFGPITVGTNQAVSVVLIVFVGYLFLRKNGRGYVNK